MQTTSLARPPRLQVRAHDELAPGLLHDGHGSEIRSSPGTCPSTRLPNLNRVLTAPVQPRETPPPLAVAAARRTAPHPGCDGGCDAVRAVDGGWAPEPSRRVPPRRCPRSPGRARSRGTWTGPCRPRACRIGRASRTGRPGRRGRPVQPVLGLLLRGPAARQRARRAAAPGCGAKRVHRRAGPGPELPVRGPGAPAPKQLTQADLPGEV